jgi:replicative DNA helicase
VSLFNEGAEQALVARLLLDPKQIALVSGEVSPEDFYIKAYKDAYLTMIRMTQEGKTPDIMALQSAGVDIDVFDLTAGHHAPIGEYAAIIRRLAFNRRVAAAADRVGRAAEQGADDVMAVFQEAFTDVIRGADQGGVLSSHSATESYLDTLSARVAGEDVGWTYGVPGMDEALLPAEPGEMVIIAARPSVGKSALAEFVADQWSQLNRGPVLFVSLEMKARAIMHRTMSRYTGISAEKLIRGLIDEEDQKLIDAAAPIIKARSIVFVDSGFSTSHTVRTAAAKTRMLNDGRLGGIVVDYSQKLMDEGDQEVQRVTKISRMLKAIAVENDCPMLALSQFSRKVELEKREPILSDLRESGALEQDADTVVALQRPSLDSKLMRMFVLKQRQGRISNFTVGFDGDHTTFFEAPVWHAPPAPEEPEPELAWGTGW